MDRIIAVESRREPWNKGEPSDRKRPSSSKKSGLSAFGCSSPTDYEIWPCSTWRLIASCALAISSDYVSAMCATVIASPRGRS